MSKVLLVSIVALLGMGLLMTQFSSVEQQQPLELSSKQNLYIRFQSWKAEHGKVYQTAEQDSFRFQVYLKNFQHILEENAKGHTYTLGETIFMDLTQDEFISIYLRPIHTESKVQEEEEEVTGESNNGKDWTLEGAVTPVKIQGLCSSGWAFSATGVVEGYWKIAKGSLPILSEQQLLDCSTRNYGCDGGWPIKALSWVQYYGLTTESDYPYTARDGICKQSNGSYKIPTTREYYMGSCSTLNSWLYYQPVSVEVDAANWSLYKSGVFDNCGTATNHAVLLTGNKGGNWVIKNSWGTSWGELGYITLLGGKFNSRNTCGVCSQFATVLN